MRIHANRLVHLSALFVLSTFGLQMSSAQDKIFTPKFGYLIVHDFDREVYDDGADRTTFGSYEVLDGAGARVIVVREAWDGPRKVRLRAGVYTVRGERQPGKDVTFQVKIEPGKTTEVFSKPGSEPSAGV